VDWGPKSLYQGTRGAIAWYDRGKSRLRRERRLQLQPLHECGFSGSSGLASEGSPENEENATGLRACLVSAGGPYMFASSSPILVPCLAILLAASVSS
jgi:hypothetical protein